MKSIPILLFLFLCFSFTIKNAIATPFKSKGYVMILKGIYLNDSAKENSKKINFMPYNSQVQVIEVTDLEFKFGIFSSNWLKVKYNGQMGYCPEMFIFKNKLPDTLTMKNSSISNYLENSLKRNTYLYTEKSDTANYIWVDSIFFKKMSLPVCYYFIQVFNRLDLKFPLEIDSKEYKFNNCDLKVFNTVSKTKNSLNSLKLEWMFDGGYTYMDFKQIGSDISVKIMWTPD